MFNILQIKSTTLSPLRCKACQSIAFRQDQITEFISYNPLDLGQLSGFDSYPKLQGEAHYFVLQPKMFCLSLKKDENKMLVAHYHPFFQMRMLSIHCSKCSSLLGFQIDTVNQNTIWMQGRILIDVQKFSIFKDGKDEINRLIKTLKFRLAKKLQETKFINAQSKVNQEKGIIERLQKIAFKMEKSLREKSSLPKGNNKKEKLKKSLDSLQSTNPTTTFNSKVDTNPLYNSNFESKLIRNEEFNQKNKEKIVKISKSPIISKLETQANQFQQMNLNINQQQRQVIKYQLKTISSRIMKMGKQLEPETQFLVDRIIQALGRIQSFQKYIYNKAVAQQLLLDALPTLIRKNFLENLEDFTSL